MLASGPIEGDVSQDNDSRVWLLAGIWLKFDWSFESTLQNALCVALEATKYSAAGNVQQLNQTGSISHHHQPAIAAVLCG